MSFPLPPSFRVKTIIAQEFLDVRNDITNSLSSYFNLYDSLSNFDLRRSVLGQGDLASHHDIIRVANVLKSNPNETRKQIRDRSFPGQFYLPDTDYAINISAQLMLMTDISRWGEAEPLLDFVTRAFPFDPPESRLTTGDLRTIKHRIKAWKLQKRGHLTFQPTENLHEHLLYDSRKNTVRVFHHVPFLKAQLRRTRSMDLDCDMVECLRKGTLPPRIFVETLDSLQFILFSVSDLKSFNILRNLVDGGKFDKGCCRNEGLIRHDLTHDFEYRYWGTRLSRLHEVLNNPQPSGPFYSWLQRHANEKNAFYIAIISLVLSAFFSFLGVIIGIVQIWLAWKTWKSPTS